MVLVREADVWLRSGRSDQALGRCCSLSKLQAPGEAAEATEADTSAESAGSGSAETTAQLC